MKGRQFSFKCFVFNLSKQNIPCFVKYSTKVMILSLFECIISVLTLTAPKQQSWWRDHYLKCKMKRFSKFDKLYHLKPTSQTLGIPAYPFHFYEFYWQCVPFSGVTYITITVHDLTSISICIWNKLMYLPYMKLGLFIFISTTTFSIVFEGVIPPSWALSFRPV